MTSERFLEPLVQESTPSIIAARLRTAIGLGQLRPGAQLGEAELARELGVSRGPLREGIQRLTQEGLLVSIRNRGVFVIEMTPENVRDMYVARAAVERAAAEQILRGDPAQAAVRLNELVDRMAEADADQATIGEADIAFHETLVGLAQSPRLSRIHRTLLTETRMCIGALEDSYASSAERVTEHREIAAAFLSADPQLVDRLLVAHMDDAVTRIVGPLPSVAATTT
ncbi:MAG: GntR family transcriptional regulator [Nocardioidaceae bacterium]|nr:GntR family transcriptional regulator [Nocardioidaceae bacterium]